MKKWFKIFLVILSFAAISVILFFILKSFNITDINTIKSLISKSGKYAYVVYTLVLAFMLVAFCFVPLLNTTMAILGIALFGSKIAFITNIIAIFISTSILFFIGDKLGEKFTSRLIGKKNLEETQAVIHHKSKFWLPILFITPGVPDEAICLVAGMTKIKYWYIILISIVYHVIEIGAYCFFGSGIIAWSTLSVLDWIILINIVVIDLYFLFKIEKYFDKKTKNKQ